MSDADIAIKATMDYSGVEAGYSAITSGAQRAQGGIGGFNDKLAAMGIQTNAASTGLGGIGTVLGTLANPLTLVALGITAIGGALVGSAQSAAAWETSMTGVAKTTGLAGPELEKLSQDLLVMSTNVPLAASELASIAAAGGSLGIAKDQLAGFTEVASQMGVGFEMGADQAATAGAKILNAFGKEMSIDNLRSLGSVVNTMGDAFAATEPQVLDFLNRASFLNSTMGQSIPQVAALGTTLISTGLEAEVAATGIKSMLNMLTSTTSKTGGMDNWAKLMGVSVDELKSKVAGDLNSTLIETANKIASIEDPVERFQAAVAAAGSEGAPALLKLSGQQDNYTKALGMTNAEWEKASSLQKTFDAQAGTVNSQWTMFTNTLSMAATQLGTGMLPYLADAIGFMTDLAKVGMKVAEVVGSWNLGEKISDVVSNIPGVSALSEGASGIWGDIKDWAGIGTEHAEQLAKEIEENDKLQKAGAEGLQAGIDAGVLKDPAKKAGQEFSKEFVEAFRVAQADREIANILANAGKVSAQDVDDSLRTFDYLGEQFALKINSHAGAAIGDWFSYSLKAGDTVLAQSQASGYIDPLQAFTLATGMPAPKAGTEAYYRLLGDNVAAEKAKLKEKLTVVFDFSGIFEPLKTRMENEGVIIGQSGSETAQTSFKNLIEYAKDPMVDTLGSALDEINTLAAERPLAASEYQLWGQQLKDQLYAGISDVPGYMKNFFADLGESGTSAFSDHFFSGKEKDSLLGMKPWLDELKIKSPEEFKAAGGDSWLAFIAAIKAGASSAELEKMFGDMGQKAGKSFADSLGMQMNNALDSFNWKVLATAPLQKMFPDAGKDFSEYAFGPEFLKNAKDNLELWNTEIVTNRDEVRRNMDIYEKIAQINPWVFGGNPESLLALQQLTNGLIDEGEALNRIVSSTEKAKKETKKFEDATNETCEACVNLLSLFDAWQESTPELFNPSYLGPSYGQEFEDAMLANAAAVRIATLNNERYAQSKRGVVTEQTEEIKGLQQILKAYYEGSLGPEEHSIGNKFLGTDFDVAMEQVARLNSAIEGLTMDKPIPALDRIMEFKTQEEADIRPTLGLNTDEAVNDFLAFKEAIEQESISVSLKTEDKTKTGIVGKDTGLKQTNLQDMGTSGQLSAIQMAINAASSNVSRMINSTGLSVSTIIQGQANNIARSGSSDAAGINSTITSAASMIVEAIRDLSSGGGSGGASGSSGIGELSYASMSMPVYNPFMFAEGGYVDKPTLGIFGEAGPEYLVPENDMKSLLTSSAMANVSVSAHLDTSSMADELQAAIGGMSISPLVIPVSFDSEGMRESLKAALYEILTDVRV